MDRIRPMLFFFPHRRDQVQHGDPDISIHVLWIEGRFELVKMCCHWLLG